MKKILFIFILYIFNINMIYANEDLISQNKITKPNKNKIVKKEKIRTESIVDLFSMTKMKKSTIINYNDIQKIYINRFENKKEEIDKKEIYNILETDLEKKILNFNYNLDNLEIKTFDKNVCQNKIKEFYIKNGFPHSNVKCIKTNNILDIIIYKKESYKINNIKIDTDFDIKLCPQKILTYCIKKNKMYKEKDIQEFKNIISKKLENKGYITNTIIITKNITNENKINLKISINKNKKVYFGKISIDYDGKIPLENIKNNIMIIEDDIFRYETLNLTLNKLLNTKVFEYVNIKPDFTNIENSIIPISIKIKDEEKTKEILFGIGWDTFESFKFNVKWSNYNLFNEMHNLNIDFSYSNILKKLENNYYYPNFIKKYNINFINKIGLYKENTEIKNYQKAYENIYLSKNINKLTLGIGLKTSIISSLEDDLDYHYIASLIQKTKYEDVDNKIFTKEGFILQNDIEISTLFSKTDFLKLDLTLKLYQNTKKLLPKLGELLFTERINFENIKSKDNLLNILKPVSGGFNSNRGYPINSIIYENNTNSIKKIETSFEIKKEFFNDVYFGIYNDFTLMEEEKYSTTGISSYYNSSIGLFTIGYAYNKDYNHTFYFNIGTTF